ncbi:MAG: hypothetical protein V4724_26770 [Pseudomonadota bacterium]
MIYDLAREIRQHLAIQKSAPPVGGTMSTRKCAGACNRHRSIGQFAAGSTMCIRCVRRMPCP